MSTTTTETSSTDRIEKQVILKASKKRVWRAISDSKEFGEWFKMAFDDAFVEGKRVQGRITHPGYEHLKAEFFVEKIEAERYLSYRWHPYAIDPKVDYSSEPTTLVEFRLEDASGGTKLTITESGFDRIPLARRKEAFRMNDSGWTTQVKNIEAYVEKA